MSSQLYSLNACSFCLAALFLAALSGCNRSSSSSSESNNTSAIEGTALEPGLNPDLSSEVSEADIDPWQEAIRRVANEESRSIAMNQPVNMDQLGELAAASEAAELLLDQGIVDDAGMKLIATHLPNLEHLRIRLSPVTDAGAEALTSLSQLRVLNLPQSKISSEGIHAWAKLPNLEHIRLGGSHLDDSAIEALSAISNLQSLHLIGPAITDAGLQSLTKAKRLSSLYMDDCQLSEAAWQQLKNSRPDLHIHLDQQHRDRLKL